MLIFCTMLIGVEGAKTPAGAAGQVRPQCHQPIITINNSFAFIPLRGGIYKRKLKSLPQKDNRMPGR